MWCSHARSCTESTLRCLGAVRGVQWTFLIHSAYLLKSQAENKKLSWSVWIKKNEMNTQVSCEHNSYCCLSTGTTRKNMPWRSSARRNVKERWVNRIWKIVNENRNESFFCVWYLHQNLIYRITQVKSRNAGIIFIHDFWVEWISILQFLIRIWVDFRDQFYMPVHWSWPVNFHEDQQAL